MGISNHKAWFFANGFKSLFGDGHLGYKIQLSEPDFTKFEVNS
jgi:hypothetical protein